MQGRLSLTVVMTYELACSAYAEESVGGFLLVAGLELFEPDERLAMEEHFVYALNLLLQLQSV